MDPRSDLYIPPFSSSTQSRILIWRNEVASASASSPSYPSSTAPSAPSLTTTTTTSSSSALPPSAALAAISRGGRRFWNKIASRLPSRRSRSRSRREGPDFANMPLRKDEPVARTAMYRTLRPGASSALVVPPGDHHRDDGGDDGREDEVVPGEESSHGAGAGGGRALLEKQERLSRAARLLNQGAR